MATAVRAERYVVHHVAVTSEGADVLTISHVPERRGAVPGCGGEHRCVGAEGEGADPVVAAELDSVFTGVQRLQHDDPLLRQGEPPTVGAEGERRVVETVELRAPLAASWTVIPAPSVQATAIQCPWASMASSFGLLDPRVIAARVVRMPRVSVNTTP